MGDEDSQRTLLLYAEALLLSLAISIIATPLQAEILETLGVAVLALVLLAPRLAQLAVTPALMVRTRPDITRLRLQLEALAALSLLALVVDSELPLLLGLAVYLTVLTLEQTLLAARVGGVEPNRRSSVIGTVTALQYAGGAIGALAPVLLGLSHVTFVSIAMSLNITLLVLARAGGVRVDVPRADRELVRVSLTLSRVLLLAMVVTFAGAIFTCASAKVLTLLGNASAFCALTSLYSFLAIVLSPVYGKLTRRLGAERSLALALLLRIASMAVIAESDDVVLVSAAWVIPTWPMVSISLQELACTKAGRGHEPQAQLLLSLAQNFSTVVGLMTVAAVMRERESSLSVAPILSAVSPIVFLRFRKRRHA